MKMFNAKVKWVISGPADALRSAVIELGLMRARRMRAESGQGCRSSIPRGAENV